MDNLPFFANELREPQGFFWPFPRRERAKCLAHSEALLS